MKRLALNAIAVAGLTLSSPAQAAWEVYQSGVAGTMALAGSAIFTVECLRTEMVIGLYDIRWTFDSGEAAAVIVDDTPFVVKQYGSGDRIVLADIDAASGLDLSPALVAALSGGDAVRVQASGATGFGAPMLTFDLQGAGRAIELVSEDCG